MTDVALTVIDPDDGDGLFLSVKVANIGADTPSTFTLSADEAVGIGLDLIESSTSLFATEEQVSGFVTPWMDRLTSVSESWAVDAHLDVARSIRTAWWALRHLETDSAHLTPQQIERLKFIRDAAITLVGDDE